MCDWFFHLMQSCAVSTMGRKVDVVVVQIIAPPPSPHPVTTIRRYQNCDKTWRCYESVLGNCHCMYLHGTSILVILRVLKLMTARCSSFVLVYGFFRLSRNFFTSLDLFFSPLPSPTLPTDSHRRTLSWSCVGGGGGLTAYQSIL